VGKAFSLLLKFLSLDRSIVEAKCSFNNIKLKRDWSRLPDNTHHRSTQQLSLTMRILQRYKSGGYGHFAGGYRVVLPIQKVGYINGYCQTRANSAVSLWRAYIRAFHLGSGICQVDLYLTPTRLGNCQVILRSVI
jgi:hypothetical protein